MASEITINRLENVLNEVVDFGGTKEQTTIISNMFVVNASPAGLTGFITIRDDRDGDTILATKVPGVIYQNSDLVNVLFIDGTEPIAFQQASASGGDPVAVSKLVSPDLLIDPVISADNSGDVTLAGTGDLILPDDIIHSGDTDTLISLEDDKIILQAGSLEMISVIEAATDEVVINDAQGDINFRVEGDAEENLFFIDATLEEIGIRTNAPGAKLYVNSGALSATNLAPQIRTGVAAGQNQGFYSTVANVFGLIGGAENDGTNWIARTTTPVVMTIAANDGSVRFHTNSGETIGASFTLDERMRILSSGRIVIGNTAASGQLHVDQASTTAAIPVLYLDQADVSEDFIEFVGTAAAATLTQSIVAEADVTTATRQGFVKVFVTDIGNQITDQAYFMALYTLA